VPRDVLPLEEMIEAADRAVALTAGVDVAELATDRMRRDALLWNFAVLGEASSQLSEELKGRFPDVRSSTAPPETARVKVTSSHQISERKAATCLIDMSEVISGERLRLPRRFLRRQ
jgi:hypothetical protein